MEINQETFTEQVSFFKLIPCTVEGSPVPSPQKLRAHSKPPCSPSKSAVLQRKPEYLSPSPTKKRTSSYNEPYDHLTTPEHCCNEISLFSPPPLPLSQTPQKPAHSAIQPSSLSTMKNASYSKPQPSTLTKARGFQYDPNNSFTLPSYSSKRNSVKFTSFFTPDRQRGVKKVFTPVLTAKKSRAPGSSQIGRRKTKLNYLKSKQEYNTGKISPETCSSFKDQSTRTSDSMTVGEITPIKEDESLKGVFPDDSFNSPQCTIKITSSPVEKSTPEPVHVRTPEVSAKRQKERAPKAPRKNLIEFSTPDSHFFSLSSSSSQEIISELSFEECVQPSFGDISVLPKLSKSVLSADQEIQTDEAYSPEVFSLLKDKNIIDGLKVLGKIKEIIILCKDFY